VASLVVAMVLAVLTPVVSGPMTGPAEAGYQKWTSYKKYVGLTGQRKIAKHLCIEWHVKGYLKFGVKDYGKEGNLYYRNPRLLNPKVSIYAYDRCVAHYYDYREKRSFYGADLAGIAYGSNDETCDWNPSYAAGFPWGVSVGVTPECGKTRRGRDFKARVEPNKKVHSVYLRVVGVAGKWSANGRTRGVEDGGFYHPLCYTFQTRFTIYRRAGSSAGAIQAAGRRASMCVNIWDGASFR
jgi:hypothetical protein